MRTNLRIPKAAMAMFGDSRAAWVVETSVPPATAHQVFSETMSGESATLANKAGNALSGFGLKWSITESPKNTRATCVDGRPARLYRRGGPSQKVSPAGQEIEFETSNEDSDRYAYQIIPANMTFIPFMLIFSLFMFTGPFRHFYFRVVRGLRSHDAELEVDYPVSPLKVAMWVLLVVGLIFASASG